MNLEIQVVVKVRRPALTRVTRLKVFAPFDVTLPREDSVVVLPKALPPFGVVRLLGVLLVDVTANVARGWVKVPIVGTLQFDVSAFDVSGDHLKRLLRDSGVSRFCDDSKAGASPAERDHYSTDVVAVPHFEALALIQRVGFKVTEAMEHLCPQVVRGCG